MCDLGIARHAPRCSLLVRSETLVVLDQDVHMTGSATNITASVPEESDPAKRKRIDWPEVLSKPDFKPFRSFSDQKVVHWSLIPFSGKNQLAAACVGTGYPVQPLRCSSVSTIKTH